MENDGSNFKQNLTLDELAETVTEETLPDLFVRLEDSRYEEYLVNILELAAKSLQRRTGCLLKEFRAHVKRKYGGRPPFQFLSIRDLYSDSRPTHWIVKNYLDRGSLAMVFGKSGTYKSFAVIDMGLSVATNTPWHGNPVRRGAVFYICGEGKKGIARRLRAWELHHGLSLDNAPFFVSSQPAQFLDEKSAKDVVTAVDALSDQHGTPALIIIDTLNRNFGPGDESSTADMTAFVHVIDTFLRRSFDCTVLTVHHTGLLNQDRARGAYAFHAALDWIYKAETSGKRLRIKNVKAKDFDNLSPICLVPEIVTLDWKEEDKEAKTSLVLTMSTDPIKISKPLSGANRIAYDTLVRLIESNGGNAVSTHSWREAAYKAKISPSDKHETMQKAFRRAQEYLQKEDLVDKDDDLWKPTPDIGHKEDI